MAAPPRGVANCAQGAWRIPSLALQLGAQERDSDPLEVCPTWSLPVSQSEKSLCGPSGASELGWTMRQGEGARMLRTRRQTLLFAVPAPITLPEPRLTPSSHPVRRRPTHRGAGVVHGVQVERATVRTTWTPWAASARLCLGRWWSGWEHSAHATTCPRSGTAPPPSRCRPIPRRRHRLDRGRVGRCSAHGPSALSTCGRASAAAAPSGPKAGARAQPEPGSAPGGAERSRGLMK